MAYGVVHHFKGGTRDQYERGLKVLHPQGKLPAGQTLHLVGPTQDGWIVIAVWDSQQSWEFFRDGTLMPGLASVENGLVGPPGEFTFEVSTLQNA